MHWIEWLVFIPVECLMSSTVNCITFLLVYLWLVGTFDYFGL